MRKVLFIEDNTNWQKVVQQILSTAGYEMRGATSFDAAIDILNGKQKFDVIVFDLKLDEYTKNDDPFLWLDALIQGLTSRKIKIPPIIIVTGVNVSNKQIVQAFTEYREYVYSFYEKRDFDPKKFLLSIKGVIEHSPQQSKSLFHLFMYALLMTAIVFSTFGGLLVIIKQIADPKTQQTFLQIGGTLIAVIVIFVLVFTRYSRFEDIVESVSKLWRR